MIEKKIIFKYFKAFHDRQRSFRRRMRCLKNEINSFNEQFLTIHHTQTFPLDVTPTTFQVKEFLFLSFVVEKIFFSTSRKVEFIP
jgi:hypothetical protein